MRRPDAFRLAALTMTVAGALAFANAEKPADTAEKDRSAKVEKEKKGEKGEKGFKAVKEDRGGPPKGAISPEEAHQQLRRELTEIADQLEKDGKSDAAKRLRQIAERPIPPGGPEGAPGRFGEGRPGMQGGPDGDMGAGPMRHLIKIRQQSADIDRMTDRIASEEKNIQARLDAGKISPSEADAARDDLDQKRERITNNRKEMVAELRERAPEATERLDKAIERLDSAKDQGGANPERVERARTRMKETRDFLANLPKDDDVLIQQAKERSERLADELGLPPPGAGFPREGAEDGKVDRLRHEIEALRDRLERLESELGTIRPDGEMDSSERPGGRRVIREERREFRRQPGGPGQPPPPDAGPASLPPLPPS